MTDKEIKDIYKDDKLKDLIPVYYRVRKEAESKKRRRTMILHLVFFAVYFLIFLILVKPDSLFGVGAFLVISAILSCVHFWINFRLFLWMIDHNREDSKSYELLERRLRFAEEREDPINAMFRRGM